MLWVLKINFPWTRESKQVYMLSAFGIVTGMSLGYFAAQYISSGLMSLIFGLSPLVSSYLGQRILGEAKLSRVQKSAMLLALIGLLIVCFEKIEINPESYKGIVLVLASVVFFGLSGVLIKRVKTKINPLAMTVGSLSFSSPIFLITWLIFDGQFEPQAWSDKSIYSVLYLAIVASLLGFLAYFHILNHLPMKTVALATLLTPPMAIMLGALLNNEVINASLLFGAAIIISALACFQFGNRWVNRIRARARRLNS